MGINNMVNGLSIAEDEFMKMKQKEQNLILFRNVNEIRKIMKGYKFYYKVTAAIGSILIFAVILLFKLFTGVK